MELPATTRADVREFPNAPVKISHARLWKVIAGIILCFAPLLGTYFGNLWSREAYQFFPLALGGVTLLLVREFHEYPRPLVPGSPWIAGPLLLISGLLLATGTWLWSPWVGAISILPALTGLVWWLGGRRLFLALFPAGMLLLTIILPPLRLDEVFTLKLQHLSTVGSSLVLGWLHVPHEMSGNVLEIPGRKLLVEEACSGMKSVLFTGAACIFYMFWKRRSLAVVLFSMVLLLGVVMLGNLVRITSGAWLDYHYKIDILTGARHETVGMVMLAFYLGFILFLNGVYEKLGIKRSVPVSGQLSEVESAVSIPGWLRIGMVVFGVLGVAQLGRVWQHQQTEGQITSTASSVLKKDAVIDLPEEVGTWYRLRSGPPSMLKVEAFGGITSQVWQYRKGRLLATVSLDYPFTGYHDVQICYTGNGWELAGQNLLPYQGQGGSSPYLEVKMKKDNFREATLWFSTIDEKGQWMENNYARKGILERFRHELGATTTTYRMQMIINGTEPLSEVDLQTARGFYGQVREQIVGYLLPKLRQPAQ